MNSPLIPWDDTLFVSVLSPWKDVSTKKLEAVTGNSKLGPILALYPFSLRFTWKNQSFTNITRAFLFLKGTWNLQKIYLSANDSSLFKTQTDNNNKTLSFTFTYFQWLLALCQLPSQSYTTSNRQTEEQRYLWGEELSVCPKSNKLPGFLLSKALHPLYMTKACTCARMSHWSSRLGAWAGGRKNAIPLR